MDKKLTSKRPAAKSVAKQAGKAVSSKNAPAKSSYKKETGAVPPKRIQKKVQTVGTFTYHSADDSQVLAIIDAIRNGISVQQFNRIMSDTPFSLSEWAHFLQVSERTIQRSQKENKPFQPVQSERIIDLTMLYQYGVEVFGDKNHFDLWLNSTSVALGGRTPKELLDTKFGIGMVKDELGKIEHGILA
jgi:putative toxin-antitoxin system antitoxin component (TIGR02293 family)